VTYIYQGSFIAPGPKRRYDDGRDRCAADLKKILARGPTRPDSLLAKRARSDAAISKAAGPNANAALGEIKKAHAAGRRPGFPANEAIGEAPFASRSISAVKKATGRALHVDGHRMLSARELDKAFRETPLTNPNISAADLSNIITNASIKKYGMRVSSDGRRIVRDLSLAKGLTTARPRLNDRGVTDDYGRGAPESRNGTWGGSTADTGASNDWRDQPAPSQRTAVVGGQFLGTPPMSDRDAAVAAIKFALRKPQPLFGRRGDEGEPQERTDELDEDDADEDEDDSREKDANAADSFGGQRSRKQKSRGKARPDEDEDEDD
jgi:hypothetical protein